MSQIILLSIIKIFYVTACISAPKNTQTLSINKYICTNKRKSSIHILHFKNFVTCTQLTSLTIYIHIGPCLHRVYNCMHTAYQKVWHIQEHRVKDLDFPWYIRIYLCWPGGGGNWGREWTEPFEHKHTRVPCKYIHTYVHRHQIHKSWQIVF